jgi:hypothetical protein
MKTDSELHELAFDIVAGKVFTDRNVSSPEMLPMCFMALYVMTNEELRGVSGAGMIYEYTDKAGPMGVNGQPCFSSFQMLSKDEVEKLLPMVEAARNFRESGATENG